MKSVIISILLIGLFQLTIAQTPHAQVGPDMSCCETCQLFALPSIGIGTWSLISGPGTVVFDDVHSPNSWVTASESGVYSIEWSENNGGLIDSDTVNINFTVATSTFNVSPISCDGNSVIITYTGHDIPSDTFYWDFDGGNATPGVGIGPHNVSWTNQGVYSVSLKVIKVNGCYSTITTCEIANPWISSQFTIEPDTIPHHYNITNNSIGFQPLEYLWNWGDGTFDSTAYPSHTYYNSGNYTICLTITDTMGCISTFCDSLNFQKSTYDIVFINVIPPNNNIGIYDINIENSSSIFPNPTSGKLTVSNLEKINKIEVFNLFGERIYQSIPNKNQKSIEIDLSAVTKDIYLVKIYSGENVFVEKVVIN